MSDETKKCQACGRRKDQAFYHIDGASPSKPGSKVCYCPDPWHDAPPQPAPRIGGVDELGGQVVQPAPAGFERQEVERRFREQIGPVIVPLPIDDPGTASIVAALKRAVDVTLEMVAESRAAGIEEGAERMHKAALSVGCEQGCKCCMDTYNAVKEERAAIRRAGEETKG